MNAIQFTYVLYILQCIYIFIKVLYCICPLISYFIFDRMLSYCWHIILARYSFSLFTELFHLKQQLVRHSHVLLAESFRDWRKVIDFGLRINTLMLIHSLHSRFLNYLRWVRHSLLITYLCTNLFNIKSKPLVCTCRKVISADFPHYIGH